MDSKFLVIGPPRGGFTLLISVVNLLYHHHGFQKDEIQQIVNKFIPFVGKFFDKSISNYFKDYDVNCDDIFFSKKFQDIMGGPKWIDPEDINTACIRKYFGIEDLNDFTFIIYLPKFVLDYHEVVHSHYYPISWANDPYYKDHHKLASIRNPIDIIHSAVHSINALTSEYIQRRLPNGDVDNIREEMALYKLTDIDFLEGLISPLLRYLKDFVQVKDQFLYTMRWEDLLSQPKKTILEIANSCNMDITRELANEIWNRLDRRNLIQDYPHHFRKGVIGDWRNKITNSHLEIFKKFGFDEFLIELGYGKIEYFDENRYTDTQRMIADCIKKGKPYEHNLDETLFTFAFQKSNFTSSRFPFKTNFQRVGGIKIERSTFKDEELLKGFTNKIGETVVSITDFLHDVRNCKLDTQQDEIAAFESIEEKYQEIFYRECTSEEMAAFHEIFENQKQYPVPVLLESHNGYNIVRIGNRIYGVPQCLGPMELDKENINLLPNIVTGESTGVVRDLIDRNHMRVEN